MTQTAQHVVQMELIPHRMTHAELLSLERTERIDTTYRYTEKVWDKVFVTEGRVIDIDVMLAQADRKGEDYNLVRMKLQPNDGSDPLWTPWVRSRYQERR